VRVEAVSSKVAPVSIEPGSPVPAGAQGEMKQAAETKAPDNLSQSAAHRTAGERHMKANTAELAIDDHVLRERLKLLRFSNPWTYFGRLLIVLLPWSIRRHLLVRFWKFDLHPTSRIGLAWVFPEHLQMGPFAMIGHLTVCKGLERVHLEEHALIGRLNWVSGCGKSGIAYQHDHDRRSELIVRRHAAITNRHMLDCTNRIEIGEFTTVAGYWSQFLTHSIDLAASRQDSRPIKIGKYCFLGTGCVVLGGSVLADYSVLGAKSLLSKHQHTESFGLYGGTPARRIKPIPSDHKYFHRIVGVVV
jgi:acetyltransferase-like isoleucine patch superfamily enzyme